MKEFALMKDRVGGLIFLLAGIYGLIFSAPLPLGRWNEPGPGVFPTVLALLLLLSGVLMMARWKREREEGEGKRNFLKPLMAPGQIVLLTLAFILSLERIGYLGAAMGYMLLLFLWVCRYRWRRAVGMAAAFGLGSWYLFVKILGVQLPLTVVTLGL
jgi:hypothetical protein